MPVTISGAIRKKILFVGQPVSVWGREEEREWAARVLRLDGDEIWLELNAGEVCQEAGPVRWKEVEVRFIVPADASYTFSGKVAAYDENSHAMRLVGFSALRRMDQRSHYRLKTRRRMFFVMPGQREEDRWIETVTLDLSLGGVKFFAPGLLPRGAKVMIMLPLEGSDFVLEAEAEVVHARPLEDEALIGVQFCGLPLEDQNVLLEFLLAEWNKRQEK